jgi:hypothetical protein
MNRINTVSKEIIKIILDKDTIKPLGRWNINYCNKITDSKIDLANEDNCGPCGQYSILKFNDNKETIYKISPFRVSNNE